MGQVVILPSPGPSGEVEMGVSSSSASGLCRGMQSVTVSDGECGVIASLDVPSPEDIVAFPDVADVSCSGLQDGSISLNPEGGTGPYEYLLVGDRRYDEQYFRSRRRRL